MFKIILPKSIDIVVASFGGVGTSFLMSYLAQFKSINHPGDQDGLKHLPIPPISVSPNVKFVYVYGNPKLAAISLFRRGFHHSQSYKLQRGMGSIACVPKSMTIEEFAAQGIDRFYFREQFFNWYENFLVQETLFLRYETIFDNVELLLDFLEIPKACIDSFPKKKIRKSNQTGLSLETLQGLDNIYQDFDGELARLNDVEIRQRRAIKPMMATYLSKAYRKALLRTAKDSFEEFNPAIYRMLRNIRQRS